MHIQQPAFPALNSTNQSITWTKANFHCGRPNPSLPDEQMEAALGAANWLLGQVLNKLSDDLVKAYVSSTELGAKLVEIRREMLYTKGLLEEAQGRDLAGNSALKDLLADLSKKADEAEDALDELHYFIIQDKLDGTQEATPELGNGLSSKAQHARHAARHTSGNWLSCFSCCRSQDDVAAAVSLLPDGHVEKLPFDRVSMSNKIKQLIEELRFNCTPVSNLLMIVSGNNPQPHKSAFTKRLDTCSEITQNKLFGRDAIFEKTINEIISAPKSGKTLSVLPIVGPGGIGKTTFTQHLVNDKRITQCFPVINVWICVSTNFDVIRLTKEILSCLPATGNEGNKTANETTTNLDQLQKSIAQRLKSQKFLIVLDDIWKCDSTNEWEKLLAPFGKGETSGNMILVTTRFPKIVEMVKKETNPIDLRGLDPDEFWKFFQICAFGRIQDEHDDQELIGIAKQIADKLKCSPLAAKTVGRLLIKKPSQEHWMKILKNEEWLKQNHDPNDIIPALKISYDYLPFYLKKCFSFFSLFPEDHKFDKFEIIRFWASIGIIDSSRQNEELEDIGSNYLNELFNNGFLMKGDDFYVLHDLFLDLSRIVSSEECAYISCSSFEANKVPETIRYLSIFMHDNHIQSFEEEMGKLKKRIDIKNLRSLMIFGEYSRLRSINVLRDTFEEIKGLRVLSIFMNSHSSLPHSFSKLLHLRYLKLISPYYSNVSLPSIVSRFYHLKFLDVNQWGHDRSLPKDICCLENLCHFIANKKFHSNVPEVGKMKCLQELKEFHVKKESVGFELGELGKLEELGGVLNIHGLEHVTTRQEAEEAKLMAKRNLVGLRLVWNGKQESTGDDILDSIQPHSNVRRLCIVNHGGSVGPSWLCSNITYMRNLETLHLESLSWANLPPIGQLYHLRKLKLKNIAGLSQIGSNLFGVTAEKSFVDLKDIEFRDMPELVEWVGGANCSLFSGLEKITCINCPRLTALISGWPSSSTEDNTIWFPSLRYLNISGCPKLYLPPLPHTSMVSRIDTECLSYDRTDLCIKKPSELVFHNLGDLESLVNWNELFLSFIDLQKLRSLKHMEVHKCKETFLRGLDGGVVLHEVQSLDVRQFCLTRKSLSNLFKCFPNLSSLDMNAFSEEDEDHEEVVLQFPPSSSLRRVSFIGYKNLILPVEEEEGAGFWGLSSLESLEIINCDKLFSGWSIGGAAAQTHSISNPLPHYLKGLRLGYKQSTLPMVLLSNLTSLTWLELSYCKNITADGFDPRITFNLEYLTVCNQRRDEAEPYSVAADILAAVARTQTIPAGSFQLVSLRVDSISAVLVASICTRLSSTLQGLEFRYDWRIENFTEEQDEALRLLTSLQSLRFIDCRALQSLPQGLQRLPSLRSLSIDGTHKIRSLPKEGLPDSLKWLMIDDCGPEIYEECQNLKRTRPDIDICLYRH